MTVATGMQKRWAVKPRPGGITGSVRTRRQSVVRNPLYYYELSFFWGEFDLHITVT